MIYISNSIQIAVSEIAFTAIRAQGSGGQNVNKVSSAVQLRFDIKNSTLPDQYKSELLQLSDQRITDDGVIVIKAQRFRSQEKNKEDAMMRLVEIIRAAGHKQKVRRPTKPTRSSREQRVDAKMKRARIKSLRGKIKPE